MKTLLALCCASFTLLTAAQAGAEEFSDDAIANKVRGEDDAMTRMKQRIEHDDATIRNLTRRIEKLERSGLRPPEQAATTEQDPGYHYFGQGDPPTGTDEPRVTGLRPPADAQQQLAQAPAAPSDVGEPTPLAPTEPQPQVQVQAAPAPAQAAAPAAPAQQGQFEVSADAAQHALERALVQTGALLLRPGEMEVVPSVMYQVTQTSRPDQLVLTSTGSVLVAQDQLRNSMVQSQVLTRFGLPWEMQFEVATSYDFASASTTSQVVGSNLASRTVTGSGLGDSSVSLIKQVTHEGEWLPSVFVSGTANIGQQDNGLLLGNGYDWFRGSIVAVKRQDPLVFTAGLSYQTNLSSHGILPGDQIVPSVGMIFALSPQTSIQAIQQIAFVNDTKFHGVTVPGSSQIEGIFQAGILSILAPGVVINLTAAVAETPSAPDLTVQLSLPLRFDFPFWN